MIQDHEIIAIIDTREQLPWKLILPNGIELKTVKKGLATGDYSACGYEGKISIERKSIDDLISCVSHSRERFERELIRMLDIPVRCVVVEASWSDIEAGKYVSKTHPQSAIGSILKWISWGIPFILAGNRERAAEYASRLIVGSVKRFSSRPLTRKEMELSTAS